MQRALSRFGRHRQGKTYISGVLAIVIGLLVSQAAPVSAVGASNAPRASTSTAACSPAQLHLSAGSASTPGSQGPIWQIEATDVSGSTCVLDKTPFVTALSASGKIIADVNYHESAPGTYGSVAARPLTLAPGTSAWVYVQVNFTASAACLSSQTSPWRLDVALRAGGAVAAVAAPRSVHAPCAGSSLSVSPFQPTDAAPFQNLSGSHGTGLGGAGGYPLTAGLSIAERCYRAGWN